MGHVKIDIWNCKEKLVFPPSLPFLVFDLFYIKKKKAGFPDGSVVKKNIPVNAGDVALIPGLGRSPGKGMATHSSILAWEIPWTEEPGGL